jgi:hypothetical protein
VEYDRPRKGNWAWHVEAELYSGGLAGNDKIGYWAMVRPSYFFSDALSVYVGVEGSRTPAWLVWQRENLLGEFDGRDAELNAGLDWNIGTRQELRIKLQALAITARLQQAYRVDAAGNAIGSAEPVDDFSVQNLGFQIRYRYELAPLSYLYVVYGRGGYEQEAVAGDRGRLLGDSFRLRDEEQLLVKLSYRFE